MARLFWIAGAASVVINGLSAAASIWPEQRVLAVLTFFTFLASAALLLSRAYPAIRWWLVVEKDTP